MRSIAAASDRSSSPHSRAPRAQLRWVALLVLSALPSRAGAQTSGAVWVALDSQPAGTPARVTVDATRSGPQQTWIDVQISGFYAVTRVGSDGRVYQDLSIPGLPNLDQPGEPHLPIVRADLGVATDAVGATLAAVEPLDPRSLSGYNVWPAPIPALVHDGTPSQFTRDSTTYASAADLPPGDGLGGATRATLGGIPAAMCTCYPVHWNPSSGTLQVLAHAQYEFTHGGTQSAPLSLSPDHARTISTGLLNASALGNQYSINWNTFVGDYLFVCPSQWMPQLQPLIVEKKTRGFAVTVINVPLVGETCAQLQQAIRNWYLATRPQDDHYCLLVGSGTPLCYTMYSQLTDKLLSSVDSDYEPEIYLGRLFVGTSGELQTEVQKILAYETGPDVNHDGNVLLIAHHQQDQDFDFESYQELIRTMPYAQVTPGFSTVYGTNPALGNADITNGILNGVGVVAYSGHGGTDRWLHWSYANDSYTSTDALGLTNGALTPVVWSFSCETADPRDASSLANGFLKNTQGGGASFYGAVDDVYGPIDMVLADSLFQEVFGEGLTRAGPAIALGEHAMEVADTLFGGDAAMKFMLHGDPEMDIKRHNPSGVWMPLEVLAPSYLTALCPGPGCCPACTAPTFDVRVLGAGGAPATGVKVGAWKPAPGGGDELLANAYTGTDGWAHIPAPPLTAGTLYFGWDDGDGRAGQDSLPVVATTGVPDGHSRASGLAAIPSVMHGSVHFEFGGALLSAAQVELVDVDGRRICSLHAPAGATSLSWDGRDRSGQRVAPGIYLAQLRAGALHAVTRVVVVR